METIQQIYAKNQKNHLNISELQTNVRLSTCIAV